MNSGYYAAFAGLLARTHALELAANNLANVSTTGYRAQRVFYRSFAASLDGAAASPLNRAINNFGVLGGARLDLSAGTLEPTGNDFDLAVEGSGFFVIQTRAGVRYTRNGSFHVATSGQLVTAAGDLVLDERVRPITVPSGPVSVSANGTLSVGGAVVARLRLVDFEPGTVLKPEGNSYFSAPAGTERPAADSGVHQGTLEASNLNPTAAAVALITLQRQAEMLQRALSIFHNEFNRMAAEELPRV